MVQLRYIPILDAVKLETISGDPVLENSIQVQLEHADFLLGRLADSVFSSTIETISSALRMRAVFRELKTQKTDYCPVEEADWELLCKSTRAPSGGYHPQFAHNFFGFAQAVLTAKSEKPQ